MSAADPHPSPDPHTETRPLQLRCAAEEFHFVETLLEYDGLLLGIATRGAERFLMQWADKLTLPAATRLGLTIPDDLAVTLDANREAIEVFLAVPMRPAQERAMRRGALSMRRFITSTPPAWQWVVPDIIGATATTFPDAAIPPTWLPAEDAPFTY